MKLNIKKIPVAISLVVILIALFFIVKPLSRLGLGEGVSAGEEYISGDRLESEPHPEALSRAENLIALFEKEYPKGQKITPGEMREQAIRKYLINCCMEESSALNEIQGSGFEIKIINNPDDVSRLNSKYLQSKRHWESNYPDYVILDYDTFIYAKKTSQRLENLILVPAQYQINIFIKDRKVSWVTARIDQTMP